MQTATPTTPGAAPSEPNQMQLHFGRRVGVPAEVGGVSLTYESFVVEAQFGPAGYVWNWPIGVSVARGDAVTRRAIVDVTRISIWICWAITLAAAVFTVLAALRNLEKRVPHE